MGHVIYKITAALFEIMKYTFILKYSKSKRKAF